jgi:hypothetical protein
MVCVCATGKCEISKSRKLWSSELGFGTIRLENGSCSQASFAGASGLIKEYSTLSVEGVAAPGAMQMDARLI